MIAKKITNPKKSASKATRVNRLAEYIRNPTSKDGTEKCLYSGSAGFISLDAKAQHLEMHSLAASAVRSKDPINHYVLSWREGEQPMPRQCDDAVKTLQKELGLEGHQVIYGLHSNTDHLHLHVMVNRVNPDTERVVSVNNGFDIEALHKAVARIEHEQGWERERKGLYAVQENGELARQWQEPRSQPATKARDMELLTGQKSAQRMGIEAVPEIVKNSTGWSDLHKRLADVGMRYERKGSGALLYVGEQPIKASTADRGGSLAKLEKRFGPFEASQETKEVEPIQKEAIDHDGVQRGWGDYAKARREQYATKESLRSELRLKIASERKQLSQAQKQERKDIFKEKWKGKGGRLNVVRSVLAAKHAGQKAELQDRHRKERTELQQRYGAFPQYEKWLAQSRDPEHAKQVRYRDDQAAGMQGNTSDKQARDIRDFEYQIHGDAVYYMRSADRGAQGVSFVDTGKNIAIHDWRASDSLMAAMQLSSQKWGQGFTVTGPAEYKTACARLAAEHGFRILNPELQPAIQVEKQRLQDERTKATHKTPQSEQFKKYHGAVQAERYRVTSSKILKDGTKKTVILDKQDGKGLTSAEIAQQTPNMLRFQGRGEEISFAPISNKLHHLVINRMDKAKLNRLKADGYKPAAVLEIGPNNYLAIITVPKLGMAHDQEVGDRLAENLNREYGNPKLSSGLHPHPAPGFEIRPPKSQRDGSTNQVRVVSAERSQCEKTLEMSRVIDAQYARQAKQQATHAPQNPQVTSTQPKSLAQVYEVHKADILARHQGVIDYSRVDSMIALRMRMTGHNESAIKAAIKDGASQSRPLDKREEREWDDYARRAANSAHTPRADRQSDALGPKYREQWGKLEGRDIVKELQLRAIQKQLQLEKQTQRDFSR